uniref:Serpin domain-containing protein n=1 Tax=Cuerna arida TaxID=1464854 RepID=A0A1B6GB18_9HEMI
MFVVHLFLIHSAVALSAAGQQCSIAPDLAGGYQQGNLAKNQLKLSVDLLSAVSSANPSQNIILSPYSIYSAFTLLYFAASGHTEKILRRFLHLPSDMSKNSTFGVYSLERNNNKRKDSGGYEFYIADRIYVQQDLKVNDCVKSLFQNEYSLVDFNQKDVVTENINKWVEKITKNAITNFLPKDYINSDTVLLMVNAVYFKGLWKNTFSEQSTFLEDFHLADGSTKPVAMMHKKAQYRYIYTCDDNPVDLLELPYEGDDVSMFIILPRQPRASSIPKLLKHLTPKRLQGILHDISQESLRTVDVTIPKFEIEQSLELKPILEALGADELFSKNADLGDFVQDTRNIVISKALHKAKIEVDEKGTIAVGVTSMATILRSGINGLRFRANHPFLYLICNKAKQVVLFSGIFNSP